MLLFIQQYRAKSKDTIEDKQSTWVVLVFGSSCIITKTSSTINNQQLVFLLSLDGSNVAIK
jgi:hypothetical protein